MPRAKTSPAATAEPTPQRADARRNVEAILDAAERCLARDPDASMGDIAAAAGLGRVTVYGHFKTRADLIEIVARRVIADANIALGHVDLSGDAEDALTRLVEASWELTVRSGSLVVAAEKALPPQLVRDVHAGELEERVRKFLAGAQRSRAFRSDLSTDWLVATFHATLHAAAIEIEAGRLGVDEAARVITATLVGAYRPSPRNRAGKAAGARPPTSTRRRSN
jgi:TetR/AcrR family transcriptional repressor of mexCD-oprJ operon